MAVTLRRTKTGEGVKVGESEAEAGGGVEDRTGDDVMLRWKELLRLGKLRQEGVMMQQGERVCGGGRCCSIEVVMRREVV